MQELVLSVIIPAYNSASTIRECVKSVYHSAEAFAHSGYEIIVINDGSSDNTLEVLHSLHLENIPVTIIDEKNLGRSEARNAGISHAKGEYIVFVDSDDILPLNAISSLMSRNEVYDLVCGTYKNFLTSTGLISQMPKIEYTSKIYDMELQRNSAIHAFLDFDSFSLYERTMDYAWLKDTEPVCYMTVWGKRYKTRIIKKNSIFFTGDLKFGEDMLFNFDYLMFCFTVLITPQLTYYWRSSPGSTTRMFNAGDYDFLNLLFHQWILRKETNANFSEDICYYCARESVGAIRRQFLYTQKKDIGVAVRSIDRLLNDNQIVELLRGFPANRSIASKSRLKGALKKYEFIQLQRLNTKKVCRIEFVISFLNMLRNYLLK